MWTDELDLPTGDRLNVWLHVLRGNTILKQVQRKLIEPGMVGACCCLGAYALVYGKRPKLVNGVCVFGQHNRIITQIPEVPMIDVKLLAAFNDFDVPWSDIADIIERQLSRPYIGMLPAESQEFFINHRTYWLSNYAKSMEENKFVTSRTPMGRLIELEGNIPYIGDGTVQTWRFYGSI